MSYIHETPSWYSWIPTNLGELNIDFFGKSKELENKYKKIYHDTERFNIEDLDISFISDTYTPIPGFFKFATKLLPSLDNEVYASVDLFIEKRDNDFYAEIDLTYLNIFSATAKINIESNGKFKLYELIPSSTDYELWKEFDTFDDFLDYLAQVIFIICKGIIHGDNHHHQKIDTAITVNRSSFRPELIVKSLVQHVKRVEHDIKNFDRCYGEIKSKNSIEEMKGYQSYINTFRSIFMRNPKRYTTSQPLYVTEEKILNNVIKSLESSVKKSQNKPTHKFTIITTLLVYLASLISGAILYVNFLKLQGEPLIAVESSYYLYFALSMTMLAFLHLRCTISSFVFYTYYNLFEFLFHLEALSKPKLLTNKIIKFLWHNKYFLLFVPVVIILWFTLNLETKSYLTSFLGYFDTILNIVGEYPKDFISYTDITHTCKPLNLK